MRRDAPEGFIDKYEAAERLGIHPESLLRGVREGRYPLKPYERPSRRTHRKYYFAEDEVERFRRARMTLRS